ncbi:MAG: hypothetical protein K2X29_07445 [Candidatus Obscuribacterales bacterium]|nr:hypothetical protein [Candidatus Obscuribacterales bacterium]
MAEQQTQFSLQSLEKFLSTPRFDLYREATSNDEKRTIELYKWNFNMSAALYDPLHIFEVTLRNRIDSALTSSKFGKEWYQPFHWATRGNKREHDAILKVTDRLVGESQKRRLTDRVKYSILQILPVGLNKNNVIAELPLSFWCNIIDPYYSDLLWDAHFSTVFPNANGGMSLKEVHEECCKLLVLRNLVAHYEPIFYLPLLRLYTLLKEVTGWSSSEMSHWVTVHSDQKVVGLINNKPPTDPVNTI